MGKWQKETFLNNLGEPEDRLVCYQDLWYTKARDSLIWNALQGSGGTIHDLRERLAQTYGEAPVLRVEETYTSADGERRYLVLTGPPAVLYQKELCVKRESDMRNSVDFSLAEIEAAHKLIAKIGKP